MFGGFWSYVHADDQHEMGRLSRLKERLERSIRFYSGTGNFHIFLDRKDIGWGEQWPDRLSQSLDDTLFLFPIITPSYFSSAACREEIMAFQRRQNTLQRNDLILPIYYLNAPLMTDTVRVDCPAEEQEIGEILRTSQYEDFRAFRATDETDPSYTKAIERLADRAAEALKRANAASPDVSSLKHTTSEIGSDEDSAPQGAISQIAFRSEDSSPGVVVTLSVNQMPGRGQFTRISDAISRAPGGSRIVISPGHYKEAIALDKPLEIIGEGNRDDIVVEFSGSELLIFDTNIGIVRNLTLRQTDGCSCVLIKQGRLDLENCDVWSSGGLGVSVINQADPRLRKNRVHDCGLSGISIAGARGTYEDNELFGNKITGIFVQDKSEPILRRNRIYDGFQTGIYVKDSRGTFEENEIFGNNRAGIAISGGASNPVIRRNRLYDGKQGGFNIYNSAEGTIEENEIFGNAYAGMHISRNANPVVRRNKVHNGRQGGIVLYERARGLIENNEIY